MRPVLHDSYWGCTVETLLNSIAHTVLHTICQSAEKKNEVIRSVSRRYHPTQSVSFELNMFELNIEHAL